MEATLFAVDSEAQVSDVQVAGAAQGTDNGDGGAGLVASNRVGHQTARGGGRSRRPWPFGRSQVLLPVSTFCRGRG